VGGYQQRLVEDAIGGEPQLGGCGNRSESGHRLPVASVRQDVRTKTLTRKQTESNNRNEDREIAIGERGAILH
jgi:hypothetical protein